MYFNASSTHVYGIDRRIGPSWRAQPLAPSKPVAVVAGRPETLLRWYREAPMHRWRRWCRNQRGPVRPPMNNELVELIVRLGRENRRWGCVRIHGKLRKLGTR